MILTLLVLSFFATMIQVNNKSNDLPAFIVKSIFFWIAMAIAYSLGGMN